MALSFRSSLVVLLILTGLRLTTFAQEPYVSIPQLKTKLLIASTDSSRAATYIALSHTYMEDNLLDSCLWAARQAKQIANTAKLDLLENWANYLVGCYNFYEGYYDEGIRLESYVVTQADSLHAPLLRANAQKMIAWMYTEMGKEEEAMKLFREGLSHL